jgi:uncharacterized protein YyaL (SSP411 family)
MPNRLLQETSPYLQQHADNPVDWHPWGAAALALAKSSGKPILLSVGYSACHWCHVMAHESFEDADVAAVMNELFVNIKVDREERPDIDQIYQTAHAMLTQRGGGWPLTMFLTADQVPFFGGTYFPKTARYGLPGFPDLLQRVREYHDQHPEEIAQQNRSLLNALNRQGVAAGAAAAATAAVSEFSATPIDEACAHLLASFDDEHGGFGSAPKFPHPDSIELLLRQWARRGDAKARDASTFTLGKMAEGGLYDHLGGGFARYSVDATWTIPHFEKMLYDNGPLLRLAADAWALTGDNAFKRVVEETAAWVMREMQSPEGGYYSTLDADSEGEEGKFYVWTPDEVRTLLTPEAFRAVELRYGLDRAPNFEHHFWHLRIARELAEVSQQIGIPVAECEALIDDARAKLFATRKQRIHPGRDEKILVSWNALMIQGMAHANRVMKRPEWLASARRAMDFIRTTMWRNGRLFATHKDGKTHLNAYLDDYAFLLNALLEVLQAEFKPEDLHWAEELGDALLEHFEDREAGGFFFTSHDHEALIQRTKPGHDNATPSGNGIAAFALQRLGHITGDARYSQAAERALTYFYAQVENQPTGFSSLLAALEEALRPPRVIVLRGAEAETSEWQDAIAAAFLPSTLTIAIAPGVTGLPPVLDKPLAANGAVNAWVCEGVTCLPPISAIADLPGLAKPAKVAPAQ